MLALVPSGRAGRRDPASSVAPVASGYERSLRPCLALAHRTRTTKDSMNRGRRTELLQRYRELPLPTTKDESWRFTDLRGFDPDSFTAEGDGSVPERLLDIGVSGLVTVTESELAIERAPEGITFERLDESHPRLHELVGWEEKFAAHNAALWKNGLLVVVPRGFVLDDPLYVKVANSVDDGSLFWRLLVIAEEGARFSLIEEYASATPEVRGYSNAVVELFVEQGAKLEYVSLQNLSRETWHFATHHARVERDAELDWVAGGFGSKKGKIRIQNDLAGQGGTSRVTGAYFADGGQHLDYDTLQKHIAPNTTSDFAFKGALRDNATAVWRGMIRVDPGAQQTDAFQESRNLLLSKKAHADAIPGLEIEANDVRCTHAAAVAQVDPDQLYYLRTRGMSEAQAKRLIIDGFLHELAERTAEGSLRDALSEALDRRLAQILG